MTEPSQYFKGRTVQEQMDEVIGYVDTRAAEVATTAIASDVAQVHQDMLDADADAQAAAASAAAAAGTLANAVKKTGEASQSIAGDIAVAGNLSGGTVTVPTPVNNTDAANKKYVDDADALKISISDINQHAVGLTGNQGPIAGTKNFEQIITPNSCFCKSITNDNTWQKCFKFTAISGGSINFFVTVSRANAFGGSEFVIGRFSIGTGSATYSIVSSNVAAEIHIGVTRTINKIEVSIKIDNSTERPFLVFIEKVVNQYGSVPTDLDVDSGTASETPAYILDGE